MHHPAPAQDPDARYVPGLARVAVAETEIFEFDAEHDRLRYRGVDVAELVGKVPFEKVWGLLVDDAFEPGLPPAEPFPLPVHTGDVRVDVQSALAQLSPVWGFRPLHDIEVAEARDDLARAAVMALSFVGQSARGRNKPMVPQKHVDTARSIAERFMIRWRGDPNPRHVEAVDAFWVAAAEHGMNASTFAARIIASTGADVAACMSGAVGAMSGALLGGAPVRVLSYLQAIESEDDAAKFVKRTLDRGDRLMGFGSRVYHHEDPRGRVLREVCRRLGAPRMEAAEAFEQEALSQLRERFPERSVSTNIAFWAAVLLDYAEVPPSMLTPLFICARTAGWSAHILEQKRSGRLFRPTTRYVGRPARSVLDVAGR